MAKGKKFDALVPKDLSNATPGFLLDEVGKWRLIKTFAILMEGIHKEALYGRVGRSVQVLTDGEKYTGSITEGPVTRISSEAVREVLADQPELLAKCEKTTTEQRLNAKPKAEDLELMSREVKNLMAELGIEEFTP